MRGIIYISHARYSVFEQMPYLQIHPKRAEPGIYPNNRLNEAARDPRIEDHYRIRISIFRSSLSI